MFTKRIIPCLDIDKGRVVKGKSFINLKDAGDPKTLSKFYNEQGADELIYQDTVARLYQRNSLTDIITKTAKNIFIPITVGGGLRTLDDINEVLRAGADKVAINTYAISNNSFLSEACREFGSQCIVLSVQAKKNDVDNEYYALTDNARENPKIKVTDWISKAQDLGVGEILLSSVDRDGTKLGYDIELYNLISDLTKVPIIAHGGAGSIDDVVKLCETRSCNAISFSTIIHYNISTINDIKNTLKIKKINVR